MGPGDPGGGPRVSFVEISSPQLPLVVVGDVGRKCLHLGYILATCWLHLKHHQVHGWGSRIGPSCTSLGPRGPRGSPQGQFCGNQQPTTATGGGWGCRPKVPTSWLHLGYILATFETPPSPWLGVKDLPQLHQPRSRGPRGSPLGQFCRNRQPTTATGGGWG